MIQQKNPRISYKIISLPTVVSKEELSYLMKEGELRAIKRFKEECKLPDGLWEKILSNLDTAVVKGALFQIIAWLMLATEFLELTGQTHGAFYGVEGTNSPTNSTSTEPYLWNYLWGTFGISMNWNRWASTLGYLGFQTLTIFTWARGDQHNKTDKSETTSYAGEARKKCCCKKQDRS